MSLDEPKLVPKQLFEGLRDVLPGLTAEETARAVDAGYRALREFNERLRRQAREVLEWCATENRPCLLVLARPYHMDPGIGHEIEVDLQAYGYPILWAQYFPTDPDLMEWVFGADIRAGHIRSPFDIRDVWPSSYSSNTNEILWGAKVAARVPWVACVVRFASYECGMDQPTYTPVQQIVERSGTLFFSFQDLDSTKPAGSVKIRVETIAHYLEQYAGGIIEKKKAAAAPDCPLLGAAPVSASAPPLSAARTPRAECRWTQLLTRRVVAAGRGALPLDEGPTSRDRPAAVPPRHPSMQADRRRESRHLVLPRPTRMARDQVVASTRKAERACVSPPRRELDTLGNGR